MTKTHKYLLALFLTLGFGLVATMRIRAFSNAPLYEQYKVMSSTNPIHVLQQDGTHTQAGKLRFGNDFSTSTLPPNYAGLNSYSITEPFYNSSTTINSGEIICASSGSWPNGVAFGFISASSNTLIGTQAIVLATTSIWGVLDSTCPASTVCDMIVQGFALVLTSGNINAGDLLVSSDVASGANQAVKYPGYAGKPTGTTVVGTVIGTAIGPSAGPYTPILVNKQ